MNNYIEFSFHLPFYDLLYNDWSSLAALDRHEIEAVAQWLGVDFDLDALAAEYEKVTANKGDIYVFFSPMDKEQFLYFDLFNEATDQCGMIQFGLRCLRSEKENALQVIEPLFYKSSPRSALSMDWSNQMLYKGVENPDFYFKKRVLHLSTSYENIPLKKEKIVAKETEFLPIETPNRNTFCAILRGKAFRPSQASKRLKACLGSEIFTDAPLDRNDYEGFALIRSQKKNETMSDFLIYLLDYKQDMKKIKMDTIEVVQTTEHGVFCNIEFSKEDVKLLQQLDAQFTVQAKRIPESPNQLVLISGSEDVDGLLEHFKEYKNLDDLVWECDEIEVNFWRIYSRKITMAQALELGINYGRMIERQIIEDKKRQEKYAK